MVTPAPDTRSFDEFLIEKKSFKGARNSFNAQEHYTHVVGFGTC